MRVQAGGSIPIGDGEPAEQTEARAGGGAGGGHTHQPDHCSGSSHLSQGKPLESLLNILQINNSENLTYESQEHLEKS